MSTLPRFEDLAGRRVAVWGYGREGRAALRALAQRLPRQPVILWCDASEAPRAREEFPGAHIDAGKPDAGALASVDWVIKSPGISAYRPEIAEAKARGTCFTSGTALWFGERPDARVVAVTGTKGKSTTSALLAHLARGLGWRTALAGNIGLPLLELLDARAELWVVELSSFQTGEAGPVDLAVFTNLYEEHLDWHGSLARYHADKLRLASVARAVLGDVDDPILASALRGHPQVHGFPSPDGWHLRGTTLHHGRREALHGAALPLPGAHNLRNLCAALAALELLGGDAWAALPSVASFRGLPHRLQVLGTRDGITWIDDSISTTPAASRVALESVAGKPVTLILGGYDRGLDWSGFAQWLAAHPPHAVVLQGACAERVASILEARGSVPRQVPDLRAAVDWAKAHTPSGGIVLLSPGAPSFDQFRDYAERGQAFARWSGVPSSVDDGIAGLGVE